MDTSGVQDIIRQLQVVQGNVPPSPPQPPLHPPSGGGTSGGMSDDWKDGVDRQLEQLHGDVRNLLYGLIGSFLLLAGMIGGLYVRTDAKFETVNDKIASQATQQQRIESKLDLLLERTDPKK